MSAIPEIHAPELADGLVDPGEWEPATFELGCGTHWWDSAGVYHARTYTPHPEQPHCPRRGCGQPWQFCFSHYGPGRPAPVEAWKR